MSLIELLQRIWEAQEEPVGGTGQLHHPTSIVYSPKPRKCEQCESTAELYWLQDKRYCWDCLPQEARDGLE